MEASFVGKHALEIGGKKISIYSIAKEYGLHYNNLVRRFKEGADTLEKLLRIRTDNVIYVEYNDTKVSLPELALLHGVPYGTIAHRYRRGLRGEELVVKENYNKNKIKDHGTRLTKEDAANIFLALKTTSISQADLADIYGCSKSMISNIATGKRWGLVTAELGFKKK